MSKYSPLGVCQPRAWGGLSYFWGAVAAASALVTNSRGGHSERDCRRRCFCYPLSLSSERDPPLWSPPPHPFWYQSLFSRARYTAATLSKRVSFSLFLCSARLWEELHDSSPRMRNNERSEERARRKLPVLATWIHTAGAGFFTAKPGETRTPRLICGWLAVCMPRIWEGGFRAGYAWTHEWTFITCGFHERCWNAKRINDVWRVANGTRSLRS